MNISIMFTDKLVKDNVMVDAGSYKWGIIWGIATTREYLDNG